MKTTEDVGNPDKTIISLLVNEVQEKRTLLGCTESGEFDEITSDWPNRRRNSNTDWEGDMEQRTSKTRGRKTTGNMVGNSDGFG